MSYGFKIPVEGDYALYCRPEFKTERVSYDVPTVSAMEGLIKSVYRKPAIRIVIDKIIVFNPIRFINIRRNEIKDKVLLSAVKKQMNSSPSESHFPELYASEIRSRRAAILLRDVKYGIEFHFELTELKADHPDESAEKHYNIMLRRLKKGQRFRQPCLGCREFPVKKIEPADEFDYSQISDELKGDTDLGYMLYGMKFEDGGKPVNGSRDNPKFSDKADAMYYRPHMIDGVIDVNRYREGLLC